MKKQIAFTVTAFLAYLGATVSCIWAMVEFILYLVKDKPFNWWSIWSILICSCAAIALFIIGAVMSTKTKYNVRKSAPITDAIFKKSRFQDRLEEMERQRNNNKK